MNPAGLYNRHQICTRMNLNQGYSRSVCTTFTPMCYQCANGRFYLPNLNVCMQRGEWVRASHNASVGQQLRISTAFEFLTSGTIIVPDLNQCSVPSDNLCITLQPRYLCTKFSLLHAGRQRGIRILPTLLEASCSKMEQQLTLLAKALRKVGAIKFWQSSH